MSDKSYKTLDNKAAWTNFKHCHGQVISLTQDIFLEIQKVAFETTSDNLELFILQTISMQLPDIFVLMDL